MKLHVVTNPGPRKRVRPTPKPPLMAECHRCGGRELIATKIGVLIVEGKPRGGTPQLLCASCLMQGERVVIA